MAQLRDLYASVLREPGYTVFIQCLLYGGEEYFADLCSPAAKDDQLGIDDMNKYGDGLADLEAHISQLLDGILVALVGSGHDGFAHLLRAVQGVLELSMLSVPGENAQIAAKGWYFLLGHAALTKFRSQKRLSPGSTSELDDAINFFRLDIDHGSGRWETWYRLAQAYDTKLEEEITWTADKINNSRSDLAATQRYAIHCCAMAVSSAMRTAEPTNETRALLSDLYTDFGIRMYSSSREPLSMGAFSLSDFARHFSSEESQQMYKGQPFKEISRYSVWNFACNLLKRALVDKPKRWM